MRSFSGAVATIALWKSAPMHSRTAADVVSQPSVVRHTTNRSFGRQRRYIKRLTIAPSYSYSARIMEYRTHGQTELSLVPRVTPSIVHCHTVALDASLPAFHLDDFIIIIIIIIFIYHIRTKHKTQKLNSVHKSMLGYQRSYSSLNWPSMLIKQNYLT